MNVNLQNRDSWNKQASRYQQEAHFSYEVMDYGDVRCPNEDQLKLVGDVKDKIILEIGCGGANCGIVLAKRGAKVTCMDLSSEQLSFAKQAALKENVIIRFEEGPMEDISRFESGVFDIVISICTIMYVNDINQVFRSVNRVLKPGGKFIFSTNHPVFYAVAAKYLWNDPQPQHSYFYRGPEVWKWNKSDEFQFTTYRRPIEEYINTLIDNHFDIERFYEISPVHKNPVDEEAVLENLFPRIMVFKVQKR